MASTMDEDCAQLQLGEEYQNNPFIFSGLPAGQEESSHSFVDGKLNKVEDGHSQRA